MDVKITHYLQMLVKIMSKLVVFSKNICNYKLLDSKYVWMQLQRKNKKKSDRYNQMLLRGLFKEKQRKSQQEHNLKTVTV